MRVTYALLEDILFGIHCERGHVRKDPKGSSIRPLLETREATRPGPGGLVTDK